MRIMTKPKHDVVQVHDATVRLVRWGLRALNRLSQSIAPFGPIDAGLDGAHRESPMSPPAVQELNGARTAKRNFIETPVRRTERIKRSKANDKPFHSY
ncbi:protein of unknown function [Bradyrhizobium vignae]|uniref:Uncharacterized protein n=1 Tax=Bradyrhizobium vignae TaxID=1549949 RepID=A0A2U3QAC3_9BRAD|nr:protein of unknown function [Bradyrhizobium vignae]